MSDPTSNRIADHAIDSRFLERWSPRAFDASPLSEADMLTLLEAARWAPSAGNGQPWRFAFVLRDDADWPAFLDSLVDANRVWAQNASALVFIASDPLNGRGTDKERANPWNAFDAGAAWMSLALQAQEMGLSVHGMGGFDAAKARLAAGFPDDFPVHAAVAVGRRAAVDTLPEHLRARELPSARKPLSEIAHRGRRPT